jgi:acetoacetyl-CoA synthetase
MDATLDDTRTTADAPLWRPSAEQIAGSHLARFCDTVGQPRDYRALHQWSIDNRAAFWSTVWDFCGVIGDKGERILGRDTMPGAEFFPDARLNFAENVLSQPDDRLALSWWTEAGVQGRWTRAQLAYRASQYAAAFSGAGVTVGDRVAMCSPNGPEVVAAMLGATALGATFSSCSPDFGPDGILDRFGQIAPKVLVFMDQYQYGAKRFDVREKLATVRAQMSSVVLALQAAFEVDAPLDAAPGFVLTRDALPSDVPPVPVYTRVPFNQPLYILFSSGTTGKPKCIVHGVGGVLLQHLKEHQLHCDVKAGENLFYFTTCGWMMWNWLVSGLGSGAHLVLYDGSPFAKTGKILFYIAQDEKTQLFGISAKYIEGIKKTGMKPSSLFDLSAIRLVCSTGSPLADDGFDYIYQHIAPTAQLASISGGTDIVSCFMLANPFEPVWRGEITGPGLGLAVEIWDDDGKPKAVGAGELVCTKAFPVMPVAFWNDADGEKYKAAYFENYPGIWQHGDWVEKTVHGGFIIHGRSDATLNPGGVRIGTAEIYAQVDKLDDVLDSVCIGQTWNGDVRVVLFVKLRHGVVLDAALKDTIRMTVRKGASPRHVPEKIIAVTDIPRTKSGKITELAVRDIVHNRPVKNQHALANPEALELYRDIAELQVD